MYFPAGNSTGVTRFNYYCAIFFNREQLMDESILECNCWRVTLDDDEADSWEMWGILGLEEG